MSLSRQMMDPSNLPSDERSTIYTAFNVNNQERNNQYQTPMNNSLRRPEYVWVDPTRPAQRLLHSRYASSYQRVQGGMLASCTPPGWDCLLTPQPLSFSLSLSLSLSFSLSFSFSLSLPPSFSLSLPPSLSLPLFLSPSLRPSFSLLPPVYPHRGGGKRDSLQEKRILEKRPSQ